MFESIIGQSSLTEQLTQDISNETLPASIMIFGSAFTGKSSIALELARILTCLGDRSIQCQCSSCMQHTSLMHPRLFLLGGRYFKQEITAYLQAITAFIQHNRPIPVALYHDAKRSIYKLIRRFDSHLWESSDSRYKNSKNLVISLHELVSESFVLEKIDTELIQTLITKTAEIAKELDNYSINIGQIRALLQYCATLAQEKRIIIIEQAHLMQDAAKNALLKTLEEPQENLHFILITTKREAMMQTILSRVRPYQTVPHTPENEVQILRKQFRNPQLQQLASLLSSIDPLHMESLSHQFFTSASKRESFYMTFSEEDTQLLYQYFPLFCQSIQQTIRRSSLPHIVKKSSLIYLQQAFFGYQDYNQNPEILIYGLHQYIASITKDEND
ncbi:hypothetical protein PVA45_05120 [Entomospira entomophila]|uniref:AAA+ ATPase domain-containing protein n=1 Tax=Entomospira entomophila TaxID=2719988 RepID=A0A968GEA7_9SPIO|nr:hypothetical protein [Entomospira entomophilus]NIZ40879.1 hypothetical protein [Entomospira entomophilus]WDI35092.1 hypothetical protein PVA45_05120 [Entomospira entomophilus]